MNGSRPAVAVCIVTHESAPDIASCLAAVEAQDHRPLEVVVVDCASRDQSARLVQQYPATLPLTLRSLDQNLGFSGGMNVAIAASRAPFVLSLNPDAQPEANFITELLARARSHPELKVGAVTGRLLRPASDLRASSPTGTDAEQVLDACGMHLTMTWRHLDRGSSQIDRGQWSVPERVFGGTGAATLFSREALDDTAVDGAWFSPEFNTFREDAELCFRLRERNWEVLYEPLAICHHRRTNLPSGRRRMSAQANYDSLKNRFLLRAYHQDPANFLLTLVPTLWRDLLALGYVLSFERGSLPAFGWLWQHRKQILRRRRAIQSRRLCRSWDLNQWFFRRGLPL